MCAPLLKQDLEEAVLGSVSQQTATKFAQDREIKAEIRQVQA